MRALYSIEVVHSTAFQIDVEAQSPAEARELAVTYVLNTFPDVNTPFEIKSAGAEATHIERIGGPA